MKKTKMSNKIDLSSVLKSVEKPGRYIGGEYNSIIKDKAAVKCRFAFCFPDTYEIGMSNLGDRRKSVGSIELRIHRRR